MSAYPLAARKQLALPKLKLAMAARGKNRHYRWQEIERRHWLATAKRARFPVDDATAILETMAEQLDAVVDEVTAELPDGFPAAVSDPILEGLRAMRARIAG
jgi:serine/threonine-protein kinase HipA